MSGEKPANTPMGYERTTGGHVRWQPPTTEHLQALLPQYEIIGLLGHGGMGAVYRARQINLDRPVAIKILPPEAVADEGDDANFVERFKNEARTMARLNHPAIVHVYDYGETTEGQLYFVMEFVDGTDVSQMVTASGKLPPDHALAISAHVCDALQYAHSNGVVHRDIKPANVLINREGQVKVADFGLAKIDTPDGSSGLTKTNMTMGTPDYVAPEALVLGMVADHRADLYAVGVMLYNMLTGDIPRGMFQMPSKKVGSDVRFDAIIEKAMQTDREDRYQNAREIREDLDHIVSTSLVVQGQASSAAIPKQALPAHRTGKVPTPGSGAGSGSRARSSGTATKRGQRAAAEQKPFPFVALGAAVVVIGVGCYFALRPAGSKGGIPEGTVAPAVAAPTPTTVAVAATVPTPPSPSTPVPVVRTPKTPPQVFNYGGHSYAKVTEVVTYDEALAMAKSLGAELASLTSAEEVAWARDTFMGNGTYAMWIGARREGDDWKWPTGEPWQYEEWALYPDGRREVPVKNKPNKGYIQFWHNKNLSGWRAMEPDTRAFMLVEWDDAAAVPASLAASAKSAPAPMAATSPAPVAMAPSAPSTAPTPTAATPQDDLLPELRVRLENYQKTRAQRVAVLVSGYKTAIQRVRTEVAGKGVLAHVDLVDAESAAVEAYQRDLSALFAKPDASLLPRLAAPPGDAPEALLKNRAIFDEHLTTIETELSTALRSSLQSLEMELTRGGKINEARTVRDYRESRVAFAMPASAPMPEEKPEENWVQLTVGNKADEWQSDGKVKWLIGGGSIANGTGSNGMLYRRINSPWFELRGEIMTSADGEGGIHFHLAEASRPTEGYELQLVGTKVPGKVAGTGGLILPKGVGQNVNAPSNVPKNDEFLPFRLVVVKDRVQAWVGGVPTVDLRRPTTQPAGNMLGVSKGPEEGSVSYRNLRMRLLTETDGPVKGASAAPAGAAVSSMAAVAPAPRAPVADPAAQQQGSPWRAVAEWVLSLRGRLSIEKDGRRISVLRTEDLPPGKFNILVVEFTRYFENDGKQITDADLARLTPIVRTLERVQLENSSITGSGLAVLAGATDLRRLSFHGSPVDGSTLAVLQPLKNLNQLEINGSTLSDAGGLALGQLTQLEMLDASRWKKTNLASSIGKLVNLRQLTLGDTADVSDTDLAGLAGLSKLEHLNMNNSGRITGTGIAYLKASAGTMKQLSISFGCPVTDEGIKVIASTLPFLERLSLGNGAICSGKVLPVLAGLKKLDNLGWLGSVPVSAEEAAAFASFPSLTRLAFWDVPVSDGVLQQIAECRDLKFLGLDRCQVSDSALQVLKQIKSLTELNLHDTPVTAQGIAEFMKARPNVKINR